MKLSLVTAAAALLITTAAAHADAGRIPSDLQGAWCKVAGNADLYKSGHCPNDIHVTTTGYTSFPLARPAPVRPHRILQG